jgi:hypothetical protein
MRRRKIYKKKIHFYMSVYKVRDTNNDDAITMNFIRRTAWGLIAMMVLPVGMLHAATGLPVVKLQVELNTVVSNGAPGIFGYSGNIWWIPKVLELGVADKILSTRPLGMVRISLGDQIINQATDFKDFKKRLANYPLNQFLRKYVAAGGKALFILDGTPRWISSNKSTRIHTGPTQPLFRMHPPENYREWSRVVAAIVSHFNGELGLNAYYESWNEPSYHYLGTNNDYFKQYYYTVLGARRADPQAFVGGPSAAEITTITTAGSKPRNAAQKAKILDAYLTRQYLFVQFLKFASQTAIPELGLKKLPVDFFSWHSFYTDPTSYYKLVVPYIRNTLEENGYPRNTTLLLTEWNVAAEPPYPEGDFNANETGAAYVATSLLAMQEVAVDGQSFQMFVDPGVAGYYGGVFTPSGIPRANYNSFRLFTALQGKQLAVKSSDPWVRGAAYQDDKKTYLLVSTFVPTARMIAKNLEIQTAMASEKFIDADTRQKYVNSVKKNQSPPESYQDKAKILKAATLKTIEAYKKRASVWKNGASMDISLSTRGFRAPPKKVTRYLVDSKHSNIYKDLEKGDRYIKSQMRKRIKKINKQTLENLIKSGLGDKSVKSISSNMMKQQPVEDAVSGLPQNKRGPVAKVLQQRRDDYREEYKKVLHEIENWPSAKMHQETIVWPSTGTYKLNVEPHSVQLYVFEW